MEKKISFGFNKLNKKPSFLQNKRIEKDKVELIECLEGQSIKIKDAPTIISTPLIIPVKEDRKDLLDRILKAKQKELPTKPVEHEDNRPDSELTINELAARELINDAKNRLSNSTSSNSQLVLPIKENQNLTEEERESTLEDYEKIPVNDFGMAMLRGMGWKEGIGIGKNPTKFEPAKPPELRPKGLGLGASKIIQSEIPNEPVCDKDGNALIIKQGSYAKIIAGSHKGDYCEVQGLDDEAGRVIVKTALHGKILTINEVLVIPVTKEEYVKNSKVLNNEKYAEYKKISDKNLENYRRSISIKSHEEIKKESTSNKNHGSVRTIESNSDYISKSSEKSRSSYRHRKTEDYYSSDDSDTVSRSDRKKDTDNRERNKYNKEKSSYKRSSPEHQDKNSRHSKSHSRHIRSRSRESEKYDRRSKR